MASYVQQKLIECNRQGSQEAKANKNDNPALFTNTISEGLRLKPLDKISVHSSYISELGNAGDKVEIKGQLIKRNVPFNDITTITPLYNGAENASNISGIIARTIANEIKYKDIYDNMLIWPIQYYKNTNGENYFHLPRAWNYNHTTRATYSSNWNGQDTLTSGMAKGRPDYRYILETDYRYDRVNAVYKPINDCSRYTAFIRTRTDYRLTYEGHTASINTDPATDDYLLYQELLELSAPVGFSSPSKIATELTNQLKKMAPPKIFKHYAAGAQNENYPIATLYNASTFKIFTAANSTAWNEAEFDKFYNTNTANYTQTTLDRYNAFEFVFHKRPELQTAGRLLNGPPGFNLARNTGDTAANYMLVFNVHYTDANLQRFLNLFDAQAKYPELFTNPNISKNMLLVQNNELTINNARFLHINKEINSVQQPFNIHNTLLLGDDGYKTFDNKHYNSMPVFFYYNDAYRNIKAGDATATETNRDPANYTYAYGFAVPIKIGALTYIGVNIQYFTDDVPTYLKTGTFIPDTRRCGFDYHFNAYGTLAVALTSGIGEYGADNVANTGILIESAIVNTAKYLTGTYIGANNPRIDFDTINNQFIINRLHTPENDGQTAYRAGDTITGAPSLTSQPADEVYFINKVPNLSLFTPDMKPYAEQENASYGNHNRTVAPKNPNVDAWAIYDSRSGIFINKNIGLNEIEFNKSLYKTLGFDYSQWQVPTIVDNTNNRLARVDKTNINNLEFITTNCSLVASDVNTYDINRFGGIFLNNVIARPIVLSADPNDVQVFPKVNNNAVPFGLPANILARRMQKPYYTIRSSLIDDNLQYIGNTEQSNQKMPIIAVVNKINGEGDFYFGEGSNFEFVCTKEKYITEIKTALLDPDGTFINCDDESAVIYKIERNMQNDFTIAEQILMQTNKKNNK